MTRRDAAALSNATRSQEWAQQGEEAQLPHRLSSMSRWLHRFYLLGRLLRTRPLALVELLEAGCCLAIASWQVRRHGFGRLAQRLRLLSAEGLPADVPPCSPKALAAARVGAAVEVMQSYTLGWQTKCLVRSLAAMRMLRARGIACTLYLGTARNEQGQLLAHAWLRCGAQIICGAEVRQHFAQAAAFYCASAATARSAGSAGAAGEELMLP